MFRNLSYFACGLSNLFICGRVQHQKVEGREAVLELSVCVEHLSWPLLGIPPEHLPFVAEDQDT